MHYLKMLIAFYNGLRDVLAQDGELSSGVTTGDLDLDTSYDYGANLGEWLWDLLWWEGFWRRWPWEARS